MNSIPNSQSTFHVSMECYRMHVNNTLESEGIFLYTQSLQKKRNSLLPYTSGPHMGWNNGAHSAGLATWNATKKERIWPQDWISPQTINLAWVVESDPQLWHLPSGVKAIPSPLQRWECQYALPPPTSHPLTTAPLTRWSVWSPICRERWLWSPTVTRGVQCWHETSEGWSRGRGMGSGPLGTPSRRCHDLSPPGQLSNL